MRSPTESFEHVFGKKADSIAPKKWQEKFNLYLSGWLAGVEYQQEIKELESDVRALSDLQRGH
jgi:hypothetical protein